MRIAIASDTVQKHYYFDALRCVGLEAEPLLRDGDIARFDGLLLPGGGDMDPRWYGEENTACGPIDRELDEIQMTLTKRFVSAGKPVLGICRGHQLLNVYFGGTLIQHVSTAALHNRDEGSDEDRIHTVRSCGGGILRELYGERYAVNSSHHQAAGRIGEGLRVTLVSDDGVVEALEHESLPVLAVQFHPERMGFSRKRTDTVDGGLIFRRFARMLGGDA